MGAVASQIASPTIAYPTIYSGADEINHQSSVSLVTGVFPAQMASNAKNISTGWRHHDVKFLTCWRIIITSSHNALCDR